VDDIRGEATEGLKFYIDSTLDSRLLVVYSSSAEMSGLQFVSLFVIRSSHPHHQPARQPTRVTMLT